MTKQTPSNGNGHKQAALELLSPRNNGSGDSSTIKPMEFHELFGANYGLYGLHVVQERALPDARDGLKPVQRRILYTMHEGRHFASGSHRKSAEIVGKVLGDRHPHGDSSVYDAMARLAQPFSLRYPLIDGQGNWGASDGSPAAAYRYTEARLTRLAEAMLSDDLAKQTVPMPMTYKEDPRVLEPLYLPGHIPPVVNPIEGIAVGISTTVPPHNLGETLRACVAMLDAGVLNQAAAPAPTPANINQPNRNISNGTTNNSANHPPASHQELKRSQLVAQAQAKFSIVELMKYLPGPDYPEGGQVMAGRTGGVREYLETGRGRFVIRGTVVAEQLAPTKKALVITALPPIGRDRVIDSIIDAINERKLDGLVAEPPLDETNEERTRIVLELKRDAKPAQVLEELYKTTMLEIAVSVQLYFLFATHAGGEASVPRQVGMVELLAYWLHHQLDVLERRLAFELAQYRARLAVVEALIIGATNAQAIVRIFQEADGKATAKEAIRLKYKLTEEQAEVIAQMSLSQVTRPDASRYQSERVELASKIARHEELLASRPKRIAMLKAELKDTEKKFGDNRRTVIDQSTSLLVTTATATSAKLSGDGSSTVTAAGAGVGSGTAGSNSSSSSSSSTLNQAMHEALALALYADGTIKATPRAAFAPKTRSVKGDESIVQLVRVAPDEFVLAASSAGRVFGVPLDRLDITTRAGKGENVIRYLKLESGEQLVNLLSVPRRAFDDRTGVDDGHDASDSKDATALYLVEFSAQGKVKKTSAAEYKTATSSGVSSLKLSVDGGSDRVVTAVLSDGQGEYIITTDNGQTLRFGDDKLSVQGRVGQGQAAIALDKGARVVSAEFYNPRTRKAVQIQKSLPTYATANQQAKLNLFENDATPATSTAVIKAEAYLLVLTKRGLIKKTSLEEYPAKGRATGGVATLMFSSLDDKVVAARIITITANEEKQGVTLLITTGSGGVSTLLSDVAGLPILARSKKAQTLLVGNPVQMPGTVNSTGDAGPARIVALAVAE